MPAAKDDGWVNRYGLQIETAPGSSEFTHQGMFSWNRAQDVVGYGGFRVSPNGTDAALEEILDQAHFLSGASWRNARTRHFKLFEAAEETAMFEYEDAEPRVNSPAFSPDGNYIMVVEGILTAIEFRYGAPKKQADLAKARREKEKSDAEKVHS